MRLQRKEIHIGNVCIGGNNPVVVQSMLNVHPSDLSGNIKQAQKLEEIGCRIIRVAVPTLEDVRLISALKDNVTVPIVADVHFDYRIAIECAKAGADKIRINPGNIGTTERILLVAKTCTEYGIPIRIGVNSGSIEKDILKKHGVATTDALCESALRQISLLEKNNFFNIVLSIKSSDVSIMVEAYQKISRLCDYPLHLGVTEAGIFQMGIIKSAMGIGTLLLQGIGDTIRVSLSGEPEQEISAAYDIMRAAGHNVAGPEVISCPTCGRTNIKVESIASEVTSRLKGYNKSIKVAVMGCAVNGPGEAKSADIGIAGVNENTAVLFIKGEKVRTLSGNYIDEFIEEIKKV